MSTCNVVIDIESAHNMSLEVRVTFATLSRCGAVWYRSGHASADGKYEIVHPDYWVAGVRLASERSGHRIIRPSN